MSLPGRLHRITPAGNVTLTRYVADPDAALPPFPGGMDHQPDQLRGLLQMRRGLHAATHPEDDVNDDTVPRTLLRTTTAKGDPTPPG